MKFNDPYKKALYTESGPYMPEDNPFQAMVERFDIAASILELDPGFYEYLVTPARIHITGIPVMMDSGRIKMFEGYRVIHSDILGPSKGGLRYAPDVNLDEGKSTCCVDDMEMRHRECAFWRCKGWHHL